MFRSLALPRLALALLALLACTALPFVPGRHDALAVPLCAMTLVFGYVGLLLVPFGLVWAIAQRRASSARVRGACARLAFAACAFVGGVLALSAWAFGSVALACVAAMAGLALARPAWKRLAGEREGRASSMPFALIALPLATFASQRALAGPLADFGRARAIENAQPLIAAIEDYRAAHGSYPLSLLALHQDIEPGVRGIAEYRYEPMGAGYNLCFAQFTFDLPTEEVVMYNPRDEHALASHDAHVLRLAPESYSMRSGHYAVRALPQPHWKRFLFD